MKIVFAGDYHIGIKPRHTKHKRDLEEAVLCVERFCIENDIDLYICLGDVFHYPSRLANHDILFIKRHFDNLSKSGIEIYILTGNHESVTPSLLELMPAKIITRGNSPYTIKELNISLSAFLFRDDEQGEMNSEIACIHQGVSSLRIHGFDFSYLSSEFVYDKIDAERIFAGHLHTKSEVKLKGTSIHYPGSISITSFLDAGSLHGFYYLKNNDLQYIKIPKRKWITLDTIPNSIDPKAIYKLRVKDKYSASDIREAFKEAELVGIEIETEEREIKEDFPEGQTYLQQFETWMKTQDKRINKTLLKKFQEIREKV